MPYLPIVRGLVGHFLCGTDLPAADQRALPRPYDRRHLCPYGRYRRPGPGEKARGAAQADAGARETAEGREERRANETGTNGDRSKAQKGRGEGRRRRQGRRRRRRDGGNEQTNRRSTGKPPKQGGSTARLVATQRRVQTKAPIRGRGYRGVGVRGRRRDGNGAGGGQTASDGDGRGLKVKRRRRQTQGRSGRRGQHQ